MSASDGEHVVLFADILGFAALTERNPLDVAMLQKRSRPLSLTSTEAWAMVGAPKNPLTETFAQFHYSLKWAIMTAEMSHALTAITFSDSFFLASVRSSQVAKFAIDFAHSMLSAQIPVRMGMASGSFAALRFRSDISGDSGDHAAQFLGTAVVRAYQAERCGIKGMRVLLHPSVEPLIAEWSGQGIECLTCSPAECSNQAGVRFELNYWDMAPGKERDAWHALQDMWAAAPSSAVIQYEATAEAINRMRTSRGEVPLTNLQRRTLPRRRG